MVTTTALSFYTSRKVEMNFGTGIGKGKPDAEFSPAHSFPMYDKTSLKQVVKWPL